jgi:hypothetical protein
MYGSNCCVAPAGTSLEYQRIQILFWDAETQAKTPQVECSQSNMKRVDTRMYRRNWRSSKEPLWNGEKAQ